jgi:putative ABC transport system substrate-binding protein
MDGRNIRIDYRWTASNLERTRAGAAELVGLKPDVILAGSGAMLGSLLRATRTIPIVFVQTTDPVGSGYVKSLARPGGNATGFTQFEYGISAKWLELLKEIAPRVARVAILRDPTLPSGGGQLGAIQAVAPSFAVELTPTDVRDAVEIEHAITEFAAGPNGSLIVISGPSAALHRDLIITWRPGTAYRQSSLIATM